MPDARVLALDTDDYVGPLILDVDEIAAAITEFWASISDPSR